MGILKSWMIATAALLCFQSCQLMRQSSKHGFNEGFYKSRLFRKKVKHLYVVPDADSIKVYSRKKLNRGFVDTSEAMKLAFPTNSKPTAFENYLFWQNTFDLDLLSVLFKYRPARHPYPHQINTSFNGVIYLGYRTDMYHLQYRQTPLRVFRREIRHYAFSIGAFTGIGSASVKGTVEGTEEPIYYDGFINLSGIATIIAIEKITLGLTLGTDQLLDKNRKQWLYQGKPWLGLSVGLNLN